MKLKIDLPNQAKPTFCPKPCSACAYICAPGIRLFFVARTFITYYSAFSQLTLLFI